MRNAYLSDILSQPAALRRALEQADFEPLEPLSWKLEKGRIQRVILTGMGASFYGLYPAWLRLAGAGISAVWVDAAELTQHAPRLIDEYTLVWIASQSGYSGEVVSLLKLLEERPPAALLGITNDAGSALGEFLLRNPSEIGAVLLPLFADPEVTPSTRTYLNTLALSQLAALALETPSDRLNRLDLERIRLAHTAETIEAYLADWEKIVSQIAEMFSDFGRKSVSKPPSLALLGRGASLTSALTGALCLQEAAKIPALGFQAGEFRHGPLEMADENLLVWIFSGERGSPAAGLNRLLWNDLRKLNVRAWLLGEPEPDAGGAGWYPIPKASGFGLPLAEIIPVQLLCYVLAREAGFEPGTFRHIGKVTTAE